jgi:hypothetical protein
LWDETEDTGGKFATGVNNSSGTGGKFAAGVVDTGAAAILPPVSLTLTCEYVCEFSKKFKMTLMLF